MTKLQTIDDLPIHTIRGQRVILDVDLAKVYGVNTGRLNEAVKRNIRRFPEEFAFRLTAEEVMTLKSQIAISKRLEKRGGRRSRPYAFTEHGALMAATVLNSDRAIQMSIFIVRAFVSMREKLAENGEILKKLAQIDKKLQARTLHEQLAAAAYLPAAAALCSFGLLDVSFRYACEPLGRKPRSRRHLHRFASTVPAESGLEHDEALKEIYYLLLPLLEPPEQGKRSAIGFRAK